jgi:hypothetical protein
MRSEIDTLAALRYGIFTAEDIRQRWMSNDNSKFTSLPNEVKICWLKLLRDRYVDEVFVEYRTDFLSQTNTYIGTVKDGGFPTRFTNFTVFTSFFLSFFLCANYPTATIGSYIFADEVVINNLAIDAELLNKAIKENING